MIDTTEVRQRLNRRDFFLRRFRDAARETPSLKIKTMLSIDEKVGTKQFALAWNLPLDKTCCADRDRIASSTCRAICYCHNQVKDRKHIYPAQLRAFEIAERLDFAEIMTGAIHHAAVPNFRLHSFGDFFSLEYIEAWISIATECDGVTFLAYTRAWRVSEWIPALTDLAAMPNMNLLLSFDRDTGVPPDIAGTTLAWLAATDNDSPPVEAHVVFRGTAERTPERPPNRRHYPLSRIGRSPVCPHDNGKPRTADCVNCRHCFYKAHT